MYIENGSFVTLKWHKDVWEVIGKDIVPTVRKKGVNLAMFNFEESLVTNYNVNTTLTHLMLVNDFQLDCPWRFTFKEDDTMVYFYYYMNNDYVAEYVHLVPVAVKGVGYRTFLNGIIVSIPKICFQNIP